MVLPAPKTKQTQIWRYDSTMNRLLKVGGSESVPPVHTRAFSLVHIPWSAGDDSSIKDKWLAKLGEVQVETAADPGGLKDALMQHPFECTPPVSPDHRAHLETLQSQRDGNLIIALTVPGEKAPFLWRWDEESQVLSRMSL